MFLRYKHIGNGVLMKIKITQKTGDYQAGIVYDVPDKEAQKLIEKDIAIVIPDDKEIEKPNKKAAK